MKCSQLKIKTMKSKAKKDVIEYKKQPSLVVKLKKRSKTGFFDNLETKITLKRFGQRFGSRKIVNDLSWNEAVGGDISLSLIKESTFTFPYLAHCVNEDLVKSEFPDPYKLSL